MPNTKRRAIAASEKGLRPTSKALIGATALDSSGKLHPKQGLPGGSGLKANLKKADADDEEEQGEVTNVAKNMYVPIIKATDERIVTGIVLVPEEVDGQGDIYSADVVKKAAYDFLARFNKATKLKLMHTKFNQQFELLESFLAPSGIVLNGQTVKEGSWIITVRVKDTKIWKMIKTGVLKGFSIGGKAKVVKIVPTAA